jgi:hypothetical protein
MLSKFIKFIHELRLLFLLIIIVGFFSLIGLNPINITEFLGAKFGQAVGMSVSIPENPFNRIALQLKEKENNLNEREAALSAKEKQISQTEIGGGQNNLMRVLIVGIIILFILVIVNYYLDYRRRKRENILK